MPAIPRRLLAGVGAIVVSVVGIQLVDIVSASAHANVVSGVATCQADGTYTVSWTVRNDFGKVDDVSVTAHTPAEATLSTASLHLANYASGTVTESAVAGSATTASLSVFGRWSDGVTRSGQGTVALGGTCLPTHQPTAPTWADGACQNFQVVQPSVTIPADDGVGYRLGGEDKAAGTYLVAAGTYTITASSTRYTLTTPLSWTFTVAAVPGDCRTVVVPVTPSVTQAGCSGHTPTDASVTTADGGGIVYTAAPRGTYHGGETVTVTAETTAGNEFSAARLPAGWAFVDASHATFTVTLDAAKDCTEKVSPAAPTITASVCVTGSHTPTAPTVSVADTAAVVYTVPAGPFAPGQTVTVTATVQPGYSWGDLGAWSTGTDAAQATLQLTLPAAPDCREQVAPQRPAVTDSVCAASGTTPVAPSLTLPADTDALAYTAAPASGWSAGGTATVTAAAADGWTIAPQADLPAGWTRTSDTTASVTVHFAAAPHCAQPATPDFREVECTSASASAGYTVPGTPGVDYYVDSVLTPAGTYPARTGALVTIEARPRAGYTLVGTTTWHHTFAAATACVDAQRAARASFSAEQCVGGSRLTSGSYTVPSSTGVDYLVNGTLTRAGTYPARPGTTITVVARAETGFVLKGATRWSFTFDRAGDCSGVKPQSTTRTPTHEVAAENAAHGPLASTGVHSSSLLGAAAALLAGGALLTLLAGVGRRRGSNR